MSGEHLVRPRWVWGGLGVLLVGAALLALWIATWWAPAGIAGAAAFTLGAGAAAYGGILYDTHGGRAATQEIDDVRTKHQHRGTAPGDMVRDERLRDEARATTRMTEALIREAEHAPRPAFDTLAAALLLASAVCLVLMQGFYPHSHTGQDNALRSLLLAVVIAWCALRLLLAQRPGRAPSLIAALCGVALILFATLTDHDRDATVALEIVVGAWVLVMGLLSLDHAPREPVTVPAVPAQEIAARRPRGLGQQHEREARADDVRIAAVALAVSGAVVGLSGLVRRSRHARNDTNVE